MTDPDQVPRPRPSETLLRSVHDQLKRLAQRQLSQERAGHTLQATALVHEAWLTLRDRLPEARDDPGRFHLAAAESMRRILIDHARRRNAQKRGGNLARLSLDVVEVADSANLDQVLAIDEAIEQLARTSGRAAEVVRLRFFTGLEETEVAQALGISERTVRREWSFARAWLFRKLNGEAPADDA